MRQEAASGFVSEASRPGTAQPVVRKITYGDLEAALRCGLDDFRARPSHVIFLCLIYPLVALLAGRVVMGQQVLPLLYPLAAGFALIGPLAAVGLYELSRRREQGQDLAWRHAFAVLKPPRLWSILSLGLLLTAVFLAWQTVAVALYRVTLGDFPASAGEFLDRLFTTGEGWTLILLGNGIGFLFAVVALAIGVVSFPLLVDRPVEPATALRTSVRAVVRNPGPMLLWGLIVAVALFLGSVPLFVGLAVIMPLLGHATWHLYRRTVES